jgi:hypothetical protein
MQLSGYKVHLFTLSAEQRIPNWYSTVKLLALAQLLAFLAWTIPVTTRPAFWVLLAPVALFTLLSIEEAVSVHERFERAVVPLLGGSGIGGYWSLMLGLPLAAAMVAIGIAYARLVPYAGQSDGGRDGLPGRLGRGRHNSRLHREKYDSACACRCP